MIRKYYRLKSHCTGSPKNSKIVETLVEAAENGKEVTVLVELRARFDEENNIEWSRRLEYAGCNVIYGLPGYKVHSKLCLVTRKHHDEIQYLTQVGTGNYNEKTAEIYTDLMVMTANPQIGENARQVFQAFGDGRSRRTVRKTSCGTEMSSKSSAGNDRRKKLLHARQK